ncbi:hypothetical protein Tco_0547811 [Tanacetum coccineum]
MFSLPERLKAEQHVITSLILIESHKSPTMSLFDVGSSRISIFTHNLTSVLMRFMDDLFLALDSIVHFGFSDRRLEQTATFSISTNLSEKVDRNACNLREKLNKSPVERLEWLWRVVLSVKVPGLLHVQTTP